MIAIVTVMLVSSFVSFLCSLWEAALYSVPMSRVQAMAHSGVRGGARLLMLRQDVDRPIAAILTFNTMANTIGASVFGSLVAKEYADVPSAVFIAPAAFTILILIFSEIIPKTLGVLYATRIAPLSSYPISVLILILYPFVKASRWITLRIKQASQEEHTVTEDDLLSQVRVAAAEGAIREEEARWVFNALGLKRRTAHELMTPRTVVYRLPSELPLSMVQTHSAHWSHSRLPLCKDNDPDRITGVIYRREVFDALLSRTDEELERMTLQDLAREALLIPETLPVSEVLERFLQSNEHLFIVSNEHGGMEGILTLEDVLEELIGKEIVDAHDKYADMQEYARRLAKKRRRDLSGDEEPVPSELPE